MSRPAATDTATVAEIRAHFCTSTVAGRPGHADDGLVHAGDTTAGRVDRLVEGGAARAR
jgi:hypothetical protein